MKLDHLVLLSSDLTASAQHYDAILPRLGFQKAREWVWANADGISIDLRASKAGFEYERYAPGLNHFAFSVGSREEFERVVSDLKHAGVAVPTVQEFGEAVAIFIPDPDGVRLEIAWEPEAG